MLSFKSCYILALAAATISTFGQAVVATSLDNRPRSTGYKNNWDAPLSWHVPNGYALVGVYSYHDNHREDRRYGFKYDRIKGRTYFYDRKNLPITGWDSSFTQACPRNYIMTYINSWHSNYREDRRFNFRCSRVPSAYTTDCYWTNYVNYFDEYSSFYARPTDYVITGISSYHNNHREDRRFRFCVCKLVLQ